MRTMVFSRKQKYFLLKLLSIFSSIRGINIFVLVLAQYLTAHYILAPGRSLIQLIYDFRLFSVIAASAAATAAGYIINNFFDDKKDQINRPKKYILEHLVSQRTHLLLYFVLNTIALGFALAVSYRAFFFFVAYIFSIWLYSSVIKRLFWLSNFFAAVLMILPFWAITLYFKNFDPVIFYHATYLFFFILSRDIVKDLENFKGDWVHRYQTIPVVYGNRATKIIISFCLLGSVWPNVILLQQPLGIMHYYFMMSIPFIFGLIVFLWFIKNQKGYLWLHNMIKAWIFVGVISIALIYKNPMHLLR